MVKILLALIGLALLPLTLHAQPTNLPIITVQPQSRFANPGENVVFSIAATNPYWVQVSANYAGGYEGVTNIVDTGTNSGTIMIDYEFYAIPDDLRVYYDDVLVIDSGLTSGSGSFVAHYGPGNSTEVVIVMNEGGAPYPNTLWQYRVAFSSALTYEWRKDDTTIAAATQSNFSITNVQHTDAGTYSVVVGNPSGSVLSRATYLSVAPPPKLSVALSSTNTLLLSWPAPFPGFVLERNYGFENTNWITVTNTADVVAAENQVTLSIPASNQFYRLEFPY